MFTVQLGVEHFRIMGPGGEEGPLADYGDTATLCIGQEVYICAADVSADTQQVERVGTTTAEQTSVEEVLFDGEEVPDEDEDSGDDDDDDDPDGGEEVEEIEEIGEAA